MKIQESTNTILVGLGPNAIRTYLPFFKSHNINLLYVVELESAAKTTREILSANQIEAQVLCVPEEYRDAKDLCSETVELLRHVIQSEKIQYVIINSEAKSHYAYLMFFLKNGVEILLEKPIIAPVGLKTDADVNELVREYQKIRELADNSQSHCAVMCQRRLHYGYDIVRSVVGETVRKYGIPITEIYLNHCDGNWMLPHDLYYENHPYQYGYGKLYHSGYHFVDLLSQIVALNKYADPSKHPVSATVTTDVQSVWDETAIINLQDLQHIFQTDFLPEIPETKKVGMDKKYFGEKNIYSQLAFKNSQGKVITVAQISITQMGFSRRAWLFTKKDHYKGNGRIRHEYLNVQLGPLMNIRISSYQSKETHDRASEEYLCGGLDHFDIEIFRNSDLIGGEPYQHFNYNDIISYRDSYGLKGLNEIARVRMLKAFYSNTLNEVSGIQDHDLSMSMMLALTQGLVDHKNDKKSIASIELSKFFA